MSDPVVDIIIPTYNNLEELQSCLEGLERQTFRSFRALVCIDGAGRGVDEYLAAAAFSFDVLAVAHPDRENHGRNATRNLALPHLRAKYLLFIDSDVVPASDWVERHVELLGAWDCISAGDVRFVNADINPWAAYLGTRGKSKYRTGAVIPYQYLTTDNLGLRAKYFIALGGQDSVMRGYGGGDTEFAIRLHKQYHLPTVHNGVALGYSAMPKTLDFVLEQMEQFGRENLRYICAKHRDFAQGFGLRLFAGSSLRARVTRFLLAPPPVRLAERLAPALPLRLRNHVLKYVVLGRICKGYMAGRLP